MNAVSSVELVALSRRFGDFEAVSDVSLAIQDGEFFSLIGPSGCGKTTTLRMVAGLEIPTSGSVRVRGRDVTFDPPHNRPVNTVFQQYALFPHLTVFENVAFGLRERGMRRRDTGVPVRRMLDLVGLSARESARPRQLSGGQQQRVALARALVLEPAVLLLDEPLGALDLKLRRQMQEVLKQLQREVGITFVYVTHDQEEAFSMSDRVAVMHGGVLQQLGTPEDVYRRPLNAFVADFVGASNRLQGTVRAGRTEGTYTVELERTGQLVQVEGAPGLSPGDRVWVVVRPEAAHLGDASSSDVGGDARVVDISFVGPHTHYKLASAELGELVVSASAHGVQHEIGSIVPVGWPAASLWVVPVDASPVDVGEPVSLPQSEAGEDAPAEVGAPG